ncbi:MAG TPA: hypothetical protein VLA49_05535 [Anaerolineales bacterium]|nr:hypothetical protein [Anaerolineales bacterium]
MSQIVMAISLALALTISACGTTDLTRIVIESSSPTEASIEAPTNPTELGTHHDLTNPRDVLIVYFAAISSGDYHTAGSLYGYGVDEAQELAEIVLAWRDGDPAWRVDPNDFAAVLEKVCTGGFLCLSLRSIVSETQISSSETEFLVELVGSDGELFVLGPCCGATETEMPPRSQFTYIVTRDETGSYRVKWTPILEP